MAGRTAGTALFSIVILATVFIPLDAVSEEFGLYTTATVASEGEGGIFASAGKELFGTGVLSRFLVNRKSDLGIKLGFFRSDGDNSIGLGSDLKFYLFAENSEMPVDMAIDISLAHYRSEDFNHTTAGVAMLVSGTLIADTAVPLEPYGSIGIYTSFLHNGNMCEGLGPSCTDDDTDTDMVFIGGAKAILSGEYQFLAEVRIDGDTTFGAAINIIF